MKQSLSRLGGLLPDDPQLALMSLEVKGMKDPINTGVAEESLKAAREYLVVADKPGDVLQADVDFPCGGSYWLELRDGRDDATSDEPYRLALRFNPSADRSEADTT